MKVSVITIAFNSENVISQTIKSVLAQTYHEIEYLIIDGVSNDRTVEVAESYRKKAEAMGIDYKVYSEPDNGIYDAMNKGIYRATGDIIGIINSGDCYADIAVETAVKTFHDTDCELIFADVCMIRKDGSSFIKKAKQSKFQTSRNWNHPTMFVKAEISKKYPYRMLGIHDDYGFYLQMQKQNRRIVTIPKVLARFYMGGASNYKSLTAAGKRIMDRYKYCYRINGYSRWYMLECIFIEALKFFLG